MPSRNFKGLEARDFSRGECQEVKKMPKVFIPKLIAEQMKYRLPSEDDLDEAQNFLQDLMSPGR